MKIRKKCTKCGSVNIRVDAWAVWVEAIQDWELAEVYDATYCLDCDGECATKDEEITP